MQEFFPSNPKKKQARLDAAIAAAAAAKPRPTAVKSKAGVQVATTAMKCASPEGAVPKGGRKIAQTGIAVVNSKNKSLKACADQEPHLIPGLSAEYLEHDAQRAVATKLKAQLKMPPGVKNRNQGTKAGGPSSENRAKNDIGGGGCQQPKATTRDTSGRTPGMLGDVNSVNFDRRSPQLEGHVIGALRKVRTGEPANASSSMGDESATVIAVKRSADRSQTRLPFCIDGDSATTALDAVTHTDPTDFESSYSASEDAVIFDASPSNGEFAANVVVTDEYDDPVVEYDMLYAADDGSYLVFDTLSNSYFRLEDMYGLSPELVDCIGEDGSTYVCVMVRRSTRALRAQQQLAWLEALELNPQPQEEQVAESVMEVMSTTLTPATPTPEGKDMNHTSANEGPAAQATEDGELATDLESLMRLLCV
ncbi:hypothetical protein Vretimale_19589 [Volvox reticuliferus]|uniref:Uncharacterized protein n=1 Tax=Volvox reticuliferus TaxID=1737510 RepID=A0A8J4FXI9_9CHLO|nr:hypothetical protein Vretifemale_20661 [Volvox reticuliferus]GIM17050.1 hypothetical protein Vretimale_19589 [Volvox reticuliferus]